MSGSGIDREFLLEIAGNKEVQDIMSGNICEWHKKNSLLRPGCVGADVKNVGWQPFFVRRFTYCPYCGRRITTAST